MSAKNIGQAMKSPLRFLAAVDRRGVTWFIGSSLCRYLNIKEEMIEQLPTYMVDYHETEGTLVSREGAEELMEVDKYINKYSGNEKVQDLIDDIPRVSSDDFMADFFWLTEVEQARLDKRQLLYVHIQYLYRRKEKKKRKLPKDSFGTVLFKYLLKNFR